ncbi:hypothetical protein ACFLWF_01805 [Chloroflexota bacterium]
MDRLAVLIADMIKSALSWEEEQGISRRDNYKNETKRWLIVIGAADTLNASGNAERGGNNGHEDSRKE